MYTRTFTFVLLFCAIISKTKGGKRADVSPDVSHNISLSIPQLSQYQWKNNHNFTKIYNFNFTENEASVTFDCVLYNPMELDEIYLLTFYLDNIVVRYSKVNVSKSNFTSIRSDMKINKESDNIKCTAVPLKGTKYAPLLTNEIRLHYIPPTLNTQKETSTETSIDTSIDNHQRGWLIWVLGGCAILTICIAGCYAVLTCRQTKPLPVEPNYANLAKDQSYQTMPMPKLRSLQKPSHDMSNQTKTAVDNTYNENPRDISEASYADPRGFITETPYIEPYKSDTYAEPYVAGSNETYAEFYAHKAQRKAKIKDGDYSNVFGNQYAIIKN